MADKLRVGIIGIGNMGSSHLRNYRDGKMPEVEITAVCDIKADRLEWAEKEFPAIARFESFDDVLASGLCDAILIAVPHYDHPPMAIKALKAGFHVMTEKPAGVYTKQVREMNEVAESCDKVFGIMYNQRTNPMYRKAREIVKSGEYGQLKRVNWIITDWFRTQAYYNSGGWRATWSGEGGGVLLNQCPHNLDLWQWICGMPVKVKAVCRVGQWHDIEVEDDVTIYTEYANGASGVFITTTGDCPGTNRLEITLDRAKLICEDNKLRMYVLENNTSDIIYKSEEGFAKEDGEWVDVELEGENNQHSGIMNAFANKILHGGELIANGVEGINGLTISNAAFLSSWLDKTIELPIDEDLYYAELKKRIDSSKAKENVVEKTNEDMSSTY
ncbi:MAG: Gfo/Idh/MocA family oxidoreductase [Ruminococcaceae bacterium]|nr:Gfo/Idh/MocA family oxidoreductase [Oscillospiraceae bacterium]